MDREHEAGHEEVGHKPARRDDNGRKNARKIIPIVGAILAALLLLAILYASYRWLTSGTTAATQPVVQQPAQQQPAAQPAPQTVQQGPSQADFDALKAELEAMKKKEPSGSFTYNQSHSGSQSFNVEEGRFCRG